MTQTMPTEPSDPNFVGQCLQTTYLDTEGRTLRKARVKGDEYLVIRVRRYEPPQGDSPLWALSIKTADTKWRQEITPAVAAMLATQPSRSVLAALLPPTLLASLQAVIGNDPLLPVVTVQDHRYAVDGDGLRYTLDCDVHTDSGKCLPFHVLEFKGTEGTLPAPELAAIGLRPLKLSKFLWATEV